MRKLLLLTLLFALPAAASHSHCSIDRLVIEPSPAWYGEEIDVRFGGSCSHRDGPSSPRVDANGSTITIELANALDGPLVPSEWGERVHLGKLLPGTYEIVIRTAGEVWRRETLVVRPRPFDVVPMVGGAGDQVMIRGVHDLDCVGPSCDAVRFGGVPATNVRYFNHESGRALVATVPPNAAGSVNVTLRGRHGTVTLRDGFRYGNPVDSDYERVLFPINYAGGGANGSQWNTEIVVFNTSPVTLVTQPRLTGSRITTDVPPPPPLFARSRQLFPTQNRDGGAFLYVPRGAEEELAYSAHVVNRSRGVADRGAELPVVRADDTSAVVHLVNVPIEPGSRTMLRIYDFDAVPGRHILAYARSTTTGDRFFEAILHAERIACATTPCLQPTPGFAAIDLSSLPALRGAGVVELTVAARDLDARLYAFVSVTSNETQQVTLHTPQHRTPLH